MGLLDRPPQSQRYGLLSPDVMSLIQSGGPRVAQAPAAPARPQRARVNGLRVAFDALLGNGDPFESLDRERARLQAEADAPQARQRMEANRAAAAAMGPAALLAFDNNPQALGESLGMQYRPVTTAAGSRTTYGPATGAFTVEQPTFDTSGDQTLRRTSEGVAPVYTRTAPSIKEGIDRSVADTGRITATRPVELAPGERALRLDGTEFGRGADRIFSAADATDLVSEDGNPIYQNQRDAPTTPSPANVELQGQLSALDTDVDPVLSEMASMLESGDVITGLGADQRLLAARAAASVGNQDARRQVAATERYLNMSGRLRVGMAKSLGANPSNADLIVLESVTAGNLGQSPDGLRATIRDGQALSQRQRGALRSRVAPAQPASAPAQGQPVRIYNDDDYARLPSGATFQGPDGVTRRKP